MPDAISLDRNDSGRESESRNPLQQIAHGRRNNHIYQFFGL